MPAVLTCASVMAAVDEITVSAMRTDANLQQVPVSVSAFQADDLERLQIDVTKDIAAAVPNMQTYTVTANETAMQVYMRGAGVQNPGFNQSESPVGIYIDDIYRGRLATANLELGDVERIEVLRGPQGTLYGRNTLAGAIKVITRTPEDEVWANASVGYGNFETTELKGSLGGPLIAGKLGGSISALYGDRGEGWIDRGVVGGRSLGEYENKALRGKLNWFGDDAFAAVFTLGHVDQENDGYNGIPYGPTFGSAPGRPRQGFYDTWVPDETAGFGKAKQTNASLDLSWNLGAVTLRSVTGYVDGDDAFRFDLNAGGAGPGVPGFYITSDADTKTFTQEFTAAGATASESFSYIAGFFYMKEDGDQVYEPQINVANPGDPFFFIPAFNEVSSNETQSYALFAEGTWQITDKFSAVAGVRWTLDDKENQLSCAGLFCSDRDGVPQSWSSDLSKNFNEFTPRLLLQYQVNDNTMVFGGVSRGFQAGGFQTLCFGNQSCADQIYSPQTVVSWEGGVKTDLLDNSLRFNLSTFFAQYSGLQQTSIFGTPSGPSFPLINVGGVDVFGVELEVNWRPLEGLNTFLIAGYADESFDGSSKAALGVNQLPGLPSQTIRVGADWRMSAMTGWDFVVGGDVNYIGDYYATIDNVIKLDSYVRVNGRIGLDQPDGNWSVILSGKNLGDQEDIISGIRDPFNGINIRTPLPPREYMLTVNYRY